MVPGRNEQGVWKLALLVLLTACAPPQAPRPRASAAWAAIARAQQHGNRAEQALAFMQLGDVYSHRAEADEARAAHACSVVLQAAHDARCQLSWRGCAQTGEVRCDSARSDLKRNAWRDFASAAWSAAWAPVAP
jgi:hypothetical protein